MKFEIRVPISPREDFFRRVEFLHRSIRGCGGLTSEARLVVSIGADVEPFDVAIREPWSRDQVTWRWVDREEFRQYSFYATGTDRFRVRSDADIILFADADVIFVSGIDDLLESLMHQPAIAGVMAHVHPPPGLDWQRLFTEQQIPLPTDAYQHSGWRLMCDDPALRFAPAYFNFGAVFVPGAWLPPLAYVYERSIAPAEQAGVGLWKSQVALTLSIYRLGLRRLALEPRYNFPNLPIFEAAYPEDLKDVRILHYLRTEIVDRERDFSSPEALRALIARKDLTGANEALRATVEKLAATI
jgi:hypothetical protein